MTKYILTIVSFLWLFDLAAQGPIMVNLNFPSIIERPSDIWDGRIPFNYTITNLTGEELNVILQTRLYFEDELLASTNSGDMDIIELGFQPTPINLPVLEVIPYEAVDINKSSKAYSEESILTRDRFIPGTYRICVDLLNEMGEPLEDIGIEVVGMNCRDFIVTSFQAPTLFEPTDGAYISLTEAAHIRFSWTPVLPMPKFPVTYRFSLYEKFEADSKVQTARTNAPIFEQDIVGRTLFFYPPDAMALEAGQEYVWQVQALDQDGLALGEPGGFSEVFGFGVGSGAQKAFIDGSGLSDDFDCRCCNQAIRTGCKITFPPGVNCKCNCVGPTKHSVTVVTDKFLKDINGADGGCLQQDYGNMPACEYQFGGEVTLNFRLVIDVPCNNIPHLYNPSGLTGSNIDTSTISNVKLRAKIFEGENEIKNNPIIYFTKQRVNTSSSSVPISYDSILITHKDYQYGCKCGIEGNQPACIATINGHLIFQMNNVKNNQPINIVFELLEHDGHSGTIDYCDSSPQCPNCAGPQKFSDYECADSSNSVNAHHIGILPVKICNRVNVLDFVDPPVPVDFEPITGDKGKFTLQDYYNLTYVNLLLEDDDTGQFFLPSSVLPTIKNTIQKVHQKISKDYVEPYMEDHN